jgi:peroxiredoxin family protein
MNAEKMNDVVKESGMDILCLYTEPDTKTGTYFIRKDAVSAVVATTDTLNEGQKAGCTIYAGNAAISVYGMSAEQIARRVFDGLGDKLDNLNVD